MKKRVIKYLLILLLLTSISSVASSGLLQRVERLPPTYYESYYYEEYIEREIKKWIVYYSLDVDWLVIKSLIRQESNYNEFAVSSVGAKGLGQFMPDTWTWVSVKLWGGEDVDVFSPSHNIQATVFYFKWLYDQFKAPRPEKDRIGLTLASYNAGLGNVLKAQRLAGGSLLYQPMEDQLHKVTGHHSKETKDYVARIFNYYLFYKMRGEK